MVINILINRLLFWALISIVFNADGKNTKQDMHLRGVVMPAQQIKISFSQPGRVIEILADGTLAKKGEVLAKIDDRKAMTDLKRDQALLFSAKSDYKSAEHERDKTARLVKENILSDIALVEANFVVDSTIGKLQAAEAKLALSSMILESCIIKAPYDGVVTEKEVNFNEWTQAGNHIMQFSELHNLTLSIDVPPDFLKHLHIGLSTEITINEQTVGEVTIKKIFPNIDPASGLLRVVWSVVPKEKYMLSGRYVEIKNWLIN